VFNSPSSGREDGCAVVFFSVSPFVFFFPPSQRFFQTLVLYERLPAQFFSPFRLLRLSSESMFIKLLVQPRTFYEIPVFGPNIRDLFPPPLDVHSTPAERGAVLVASRSNSRKDPFFFLDFPFSRIIPKTGLLPLRFSLSNRFFPLCCGTMFVFLVPRGEELEV